MVPVKRADKRIKKKDETPDLKECTISEECKQELEDIREEIKKGHYIKVKDVKELAKRCGLEK
jgi:hypothetical protein